MPGFEALETLLFFVIYVTFIKTVIEACCQKDRKEKLYLF